MEDTPSMLDVGSVGGTESGRKGRGGGDEAARKFDFAMLRVDDDDDDDDDDDVSGNTASSGQK